MPIDWNATIDSLRQEVPGAQFHNWIKPLQLVHSNQGRVVVGVPSRFHQDWLQENYQQTLREALQKQTGSEVQLEFEILEPSETSPVETSAVATPVRPQLRIVGAVETPAAGQPLPTPPPPVTPLPPLPTFPNAYFEFGFNSIASQCSFLFLEGHPGMNPFGVLAGTGLGKSHLLCEIGQRYQQANPRLRVRYTNAESFTTEMVQGIRNNDSFGFKTKYRVETDVLLFDDIHLLSKRLKTQEELLHVFNEIQGRGGKFAFTTAIAPRELRDFLEPLRSRLLAGILAEIHAPTLEQRVEVVGWTAAQHQIPLDGMVQRVLAEAHVDLRELMGSVVRAHLQSRLQNTPLSADFVSREVANPVPQVAPKITLGDIVALVEHNFGVSRSELTSKSRKTQTAWARQVAMYLARQYTLHPLEEIGRTFGRDHATVIHSFQKVAEAMETQPTKKYEVEFLKRKLQGQLPPSC